MVNKVYDKLKKYIEENWKFLIALISIILLFTVELPYYIYMPGGSINLDKRIVVDGSNDEKGTFNMAYVSVMKSTIPTILFSYILPNWDLEKITDIKFADETESQMENRDRLDYEEAMDNSLMAAFSQTDKYLQVNNSYNEVTYVSKDAKTELKVGDYIIKANDKNITNINEYKNIVENSNIGDKINLLIKRDKKEKNITIEVFDDGGSKKTGILFLTLYDITTKPNVKIKTKRSESGPSGGLMMSLSIYNQLTEYDLTQGRKIIGTGTIDPMGNVGEIGGVKYKLLGAIKNKAEVFICPKENYNEALEVLNTTKSDIKIIGVATLGEAIFELSL